MDKIKIYLSSVPYIIIIGLTIFGYWHVAKKHSANELNISMWIFPIATYHGLEFFWHNDFADVDWKDQNQRDMKMLGYFFLRYENDSARYNLSKEIKEFSIDINKYPKAQLDYLKNGAKSYIFFMRHMSSDIENYSLNYFHGDTLQFVFSDSTKNIIKLLKTKYYLDESLSENDMDKTLHERLRFPNNMTPSQIQIDNYVQTLRKNHEDGDYSFRQVYKEIFKEPFDNY